MTVIPVRLSKSNRKVGRVLSFSLPALLTCPGASIWCREHCYARRIETCRPNCREAFAHNYAVSRDSRAFLSLMLEHLPRGLPCFRIHVSGDFYSLAYTDCWRVICQARPETRFWAYTRSWNVPVLLPALERLRALPNVQLFASLDSTMPAPPEGWRVAYIEDDPRADGLPCREQHGIEESCRACGYCFRGRRGHVVFKVH